MPTSFLSDDQLYEGYERGAIAIEEHGCGTIEEQHESVSLADESEQKTATPSPTPTQITNEYTLGKFIFDALGPLGILSISLGAAIAAFMVACWQHFSRLVNGSLAVLMILLCAAPFAMPLNIERAYQGYERGAIGVHTLMGAFKTIVDSGATSTAVPEGLANILYDVTDPSPKKKLYIANDNGLDILKIGKAKLKVTGYRKENPSVWFIDELPVSRMLVVRGMAKNQILLSVRGMKKDGVYTYFNDDNSLGRSDCLRLPTGTIVPFLPSSHAYNLSVGEHARVGIEATRPRGVRPSQAIHSALGHSGSRRINDSNISIDGQHVKMPERLDESCIGCRLGNTGKEHVPTKKSKWKEGTRASASHTSANKWTPTFARDLSRRFRMVLRR